MKKGLFQSVSPDKVLLHSVNKILCLNRTFTWISPFAFYLALLLAVVTIFLSKGHYHNGLSTIISQDYCIDHWPCFRYGPESANWPDISTAYFLQYHDKFITKCLHWQSCSEQLALLYIPVYNSIKLVKPVKVINVMLGNKITG